GGSPAIVTPNRCCRDDRRGAPDTGRDSSPAPTGAKTRTLISAPDNPSLMERDEALALLRRYVVSPSHIAHSYATAGIMKRVAEHLGEDAGTWEIIGLLHDIDYDLVAGDMDRHGIEGHRILIENGVPEEIADIVRRHNHTHFSDYVRPVEIALQAADSASGLIIACALVKGGAVSEVAPRTVKKKFKEKSFAAGCERERIRMIEPLMDMETFFRLAIEGIMDIRTDIGLT
ncbi:MAG TPA: HDIG domain-containing protein, partial [Methanoculleus sp.]|nr:HDIG domain-containing protein [Methanoculleus sp.]